MTTGFLGQGNQKDDILKPYNGLYYTEDTGFKYFLPYYLWNLSSAIYLNWIELAKNGISSRWIGKLHCELIKNIYKASAFPASLNTYKDIKDFERLKTLNDSRNQISFLDPF